MPEGAASAAAGSNGDGQPKALPADVRAMLAEFFDTAKIPDRERKIFHQNAKLRHKNSELRAELERVQGTAPKDGAVVLAKDDAAEYAAFKKLNVKAADLVNVVKEHGELKVKVAERDAEEMYVEVADALGFENLPLFMRTMSREGLHVEFQDQRVKDEETGRMIVVRVPMVRAKADDKAQLEPLSEYLEREIPEIAEAMIAAPADDEEGEETAGSARRVGAGDPEARRAAAAPRVPGVTMPVTHSPRKSTSGSRDEKRLKEAYEEKRTNAAYAGL